MPIGCASMAPRGLNITSPPSPIELVVSKLTFENDNKVIRAGEILEGCFEVIHVPNIAPEIKGLFLEFDGKCLCVDIVRDFREYKTVAEVRKYFYGDGCANMGPLKEKRYDFSLTIPEDCPATFTTGKYGWIKYTLKVTALQNTGLGMHSFESEEITIIPKIVQEWKNQTYYLEPMLAQKKLSGFMFSGHVFLTLTTGRKCYSPGEDIHFVVKVKNAGSKNVRTMKMQIQQNVCYGAGSAEVNQNETIMFSDCVEGPSAPANYTQTWRGTLKVPSDTLPSLEEIDQSNTASISFKYYLHITLHMAGGLVPKISEKFPIEIGHPLESPPESTCGGNSSLLTPNTSGLNRRMSMISLAPSLPDYDTATAVGGTILGLLPPSYSCLEFYANVK